MKKTLQLLCLFAVLIAAVSLCTLPASAQTCPGIGGSPTNNWCGPYSFGTVACMSGSSSSGCDGTNNVGFVAKPAGSGSFTHKFTGISASSLSSPTDDVSPKGTVGSVQYLQYVNGSVQAYDKATGNPILVPSLTSLSSTPQPYYGPFYGTTSLHPLRALCDSFSADNVEVKYDKPDSVFVIAGVEIDSSGYTHLCITASTQDDLYAGSGSAAANSYWSAYGFTLTDLMLTDGGQSAIPTNFRLGTGSDKFYVAFDEQDNTPGSSSNGRVVASALCKLDKATIVNGQQTYNPVCYVWYPNSASANQSINLHAFQPSDLQDSESSTPEYFIGQGNPYASGSDPYAGTACLAITCGDTASLAELTWTEIANQYSWYSVKSKLAPLTAYNWWPGCYGTNGNYDIDSSEKGCIYQPWMGDDLLDSQSNVLGNVAYRTNYSTEKLYMATSFTANQGSYEAQPPTAVQVGILTLGTDGTTVIIDPYTFEDTRQYGYPYWEGSVAIDSSFNVGVAYSTMLPYYDSFYPSVGKSYVISGESAQVPTGVQLGAGVNANEGNAIDVYENNWGPTTAIAVDSSDNMWGTGEWLTASQGYGSCPSGSGCTWATTVFTCHGSGTTGSGCRLPTPTTLR